MSQTIGREQELSALSAFLDDAQREPVALVLEGEAGIGKTHLWRETVTMAERLGFAVLAARAAGPEVELSYAALADLVERMPEEVRVALPSPQRHALEVALLLAEPGPEPPDERAVAAALLVTLRAVASEQPVLVAVDDVQWLDSATGRALGFALRRIRAERIATLLTLRVGDGAVDDPHGLLQALAERALCRIELRGVTVGALHEILRVSFGSSLSRRTLLRMHDATGGNPFFALELARTLQRHHGEPAAHEPLPVPEKLHELVASRLGGLTPSVQDALLIAASAARPTVELLTTATGNGSQLVPQLEEAEAADVIRVDRNVIRFTHPLLRSMHISRASRNERRRAHRLLAPVVAEPEERARHLALATAGPDEAVAADLEEAAAHVRARGAAAAAAALLEQSYRLTPATEKEAAARRATDAAEAAFEIGDLDRSKQLIEDVGALDPGREPVVLAMLARVALQTSNAHAIEPYDRAAASAGDPALEADIRISLSNAQYIGGDDLTAAATNARRAIEIADELRDDRLLVRALGAAAAAEALFGGPRAQAILRRGLAVEKRTHDWMRRPNHGFLEARSYGDDQADVRAYATELYEQATAGVAGDVVPAMWGPIYNGAWADMLLGRWPEAKASTDAAIAAALDSRSDHAHAGFLALRALLDAHLGETASARDTAREALDLGARTGIDGPNWGIPVALAALGLVALALRDPAETHARLAPLTARLRRLGIGEPGALRFVPDEIQGLVELGRLEEAHELLAWFDACAVRAERDSARGTAARSRALLSAAAGDLADAEQHLERSRTWLERIELPFELARTLLELGIVRRRLQRKTDARQTLTEAVEHFDRLGAKIWAERARTELGRIGGRAPAEGELSATESEIARLVLDGRTNRQVAEALHLSTHTVEWNLSRIYRKLGVRSRTQLPRSLR